ncbi:MAG: DnaA regulatory inactivator Hda [Thiohalomonadales bacterium]
MLNQQQILDITLKTQSNLDNFVVGDNQELVDTLSKILMSADENMMYIWGESGVGKTHLLHGLCQLSRLQRQSIAYIPMSLPEINIQYLQSLENVPIICIDDIHLIASKPDWQLAYFHLYNQIRDRGHKLLVSANAPPSRIDIALSDLRTRFAWGLVYQVQGLDDRGKSMALKQQAHARGFELSDQVIQYLLSHYSRDTHFLFSILNKLDQASMAAQRKITIPFVKKILD